MATHMTYKTHNGQHHSEGGGFSVVTGLDDEDDGCGHGLGQLVGAHSVALEGEVGEHHKAAEGQAEGEEVGEGNPLRGEHTKPGADPHPQACDGKVDEGEGDAGEAIANVDELVEEDD